MQRHDPTFGTRLGEKSQRLCRKYLEEAATTPKLFDGKAATVRKALKIFPASTAIGSDD